MCGVGSTKEEAQVTLKNVHEIVREATFRVDARPDRFGIEAEWFPLRNRSLKRVPIAITERLIRKGTDLVARDGDNPSWLNNVGGAVTYEPGGQIEHSGVAHDTVPAAFAELAITHGALIDALAKDGIALVPGGIDHWNPVTDIEQQLAGPRYPAMASYFASRGPAGRLMMRHTASLQISLDTGRGAIARERWVVANRVSPLVTATFSTSPCAGLHSRRAQIWQDVDPTRTGLPSRLDPEDDPVDVLVEAALSGDVLVVIREDGALAGRPGWTLADWIREGHPDAGLPTADDIRYHLTTLFPEVRLRQSVLEMRAIDGLPDRWCTIPAVLLAGLLYDDVTRDLALEASEGFDATDLLRRATVVGMADSEVARLARSLWTLALDGAYRIGVDVLGDLEEAAVFVATKLSEGATLADEVRQRLAMDPVETARWLANR